MSILSAVLYLLANLIMIKVSLRSMEVIGKCMGQIFDDDKDMHQHMGKASVNCKFASLLSVFKRRILFK